MAKKHICDEYEIEKMRIITFNLIFYDISYKVKDDVFVHLCCYHNSKCQSHKYLKIMSSYRRRK